MKDAEARATAHTALESAETAHSRITEGLRRVVALEGESKIERRYCPTCKRETLTATSYYFFRGKGCIDHFTCEICGTKYEINTEERITILNPVKRSHKKKGN